MTVCCGRIVTNWSRYALTRRRFLASNNNRMTFKPEMTSHSARNLYAPHENRGVPKTHLPNSAQPAENGGPPSRSLAFKKKCFRGAVRREHPMFTHRLKNNRSMRTMVTMGQID